MAGDSQWAVQQAIYAALTGNAALQALLGNPARIYDHVPDTPVYPYVTLGETFAGDFDTKSFDGMDQDVVLHVWSRYRGKKEAKQILGAIHDVLNKQPLSVTGQNFVLCQFTFGQVFDDPDGLTRHGVARYRVLTHD